MHLHVFRPCHSLNALPWPDPKKKKIVCAIQYSLAARDIATNIKKHGHIIQTDPTLKKLFTTPEWCTKDPQPSPTHFLSLIPSGNYPCGHCQHATLRTRLTSLMIQIQEKKYNIIVVISCCTANVTCLNVHADWHMLVRPPDLWRLVLLSVTVPSETMLYPVQSLYIFLWLNITPLHSDKLGWRL